MLKKIRQGFANHHPLKNSQIQKRASVIIPLLEKLDRDRVTVRQRDLRVLRTT